jgi:hypothetical protein
MLDLERTAEVEKVFAHFGESLMAAGVDTIKNY